MTTEKNAGFTALELLTAILVLLVLGTVFLLQKNSLEAEHRDSDRKTAINAMYHNLEEITYKKLGGYPIVLTKADLPAMDEALLTDPRGKKLGETGSEYRYSPSDCDGKICKNYTLSSRLEREAVYERKSTR